MTAIQQTDSIKAKANKIVNSLAGCPIELKKELNKIGLRYVKTNRGFNTLYIVRGKEINDKIVIKL